MDNNNTRFDSKRLIENRQVRIFLSSTFSDMQEERSELVKRLNSLKLEANRRNVALSLLDLRWGVTDEEARSGKVLSVCLNEIENSHPFFIGLLGNRYGYAPALSELEKNPDLKERYPWLKQDMSDKLSITEMEMQYGVLRNNNDIDAAFFIKKGDQPDDNPRLTALKTKIREQRRYPVKDYNTVEELCTMVEQAVMQILDLHFPETEITPLDRERIAQRAYINSRHTHYIKRQSYFDTIDRFIRSDECHLVFTGESGMGKSALLANWIKENEKSDDFNLVYHFVGNSFSGNNYESILNHLCDEICQLYGIARIEDMHRKIEEEARTLVSLVSSREKPLIVVIDGINQIDAPKDEKLLLWLPEANDKVKFIFSTLRDDDTMRSFERRHYHIEEVIPLERDERIKFVVDYLETVGKHLNEAQLNRIVDDPENENTLVLKTLLDELICFGVHEQLNERIDYYLSDTSIPDFFDRVLQRMEEDYSANQDLVRHTLTLIALSEHGLSEDELLSILKCRPYDWHLFYCAFFNHFVVKDGIISFSHQYMATAVAGRYHTDDSTATKPYRHEITNYFSQQPSTDRRISELSHQYYNLDEWDKLHGTLLSFEAFHYFNATNKFFLVKYWRALLNAGKGQYQLTDYLQLTHYETDNALTTNYNNIGLFVHIYFADYDKALEYCLRALAKREKVLGTEHPDTATSYNNIGGVYYNKGDYDKALEYYLRALAINEKVLGTEHPNTATSYSNIGIVYNDKGDYGKALEYYLKALAIREKILGTEHSDTAASYNNIGSVYDDKGDYNKALEYHLKDLEIIEKVLGAEHPDTASSYSNIGLVYYNKGDYDKSLEYHLKALAINEKVLGTEHPSTAQSYNNIGLLYHNKGDYDKVLEYYLKALAIREKVFGTEHPDTATSYNNIGVVYKNKGNYDKALEYHLKALAINEKVFGTEHPDTAQSYNNIGLLYHNKGNYDKSLEYYLKALAIGEKVLGTEHPDTAQSYNNIGLLYHNKGDYDKSLEYYLKALAIREKVLGTEHPDTATSYNDIGGVYNDIGDYDKVLEYFIKALAICEKALGTEHPDTATSYNNIGLVYYNKGVYDKALEYYLKALLIREKVLGAEHPDTAASYNNIGGVYDNKGNYDKALEYYLKALAIKEKALGSENPDTAILYGNIGLVYNNKGDYAKALEYYLKAVAIFERVLGTEHPHTATSYNNIGLVYNNKGNYDKTLEYYLKALAIFEKALGTEHPHTATSYNNIGLVYYNKGDYDKSLEYYLKALAIREKVLGAEHPATATSYNNIGTVYDDKGDYDKALKYHLKALAIREEVLGAEHPDTAYSYNNIGALYYNMKKYPEALAYFEKALLIFKSTLRENHPNTQMVQESIDSTKAAMGKTDSGK